MVYLSCGHGGSPVPDRLTTGITFKLSRMQNSCCQDGEWEERCISEVGARRGVSKSGCGLSDMEKLGENTAGPRPRSGFGRSGWGQDD